LLGKSAVQTSPSLKVSSSTALLSLSSLRDGDGPPLPALSSAVAADGSSLLLCPLFFCLIRRAAAGLRERI